MESETTQEQNINKILTDLGKSIKNYYDLYEKELVVQKEICENVWVLIQRFKILKDGQEKLRRKEADLVDVIEAEMLCQFNREIQKIHKSK